MMRDPYEPFGGEPQDVTGFTAQDLDARTPGEQRAAAIAACNLCNADGYRIAGGRAAGIRCDHIDHAAIAERHRAEIRAQLAQIAARKQPPHPTPDRSPSTP